MQAKETAKARLTYQKRGEGGGAVAICTATCWTQSISCELLLSKCKVWLEKSNRKKAKKRKE